MYQFALFVVVQVLKMEDNIIANFANTSKNCPFFLHQICSRKSNFPDDRALFLENANGICLKRHVHHSWEGTSLAIWERAVALKTSAAQWEPKIWVLYLTGILNYILLSCFAICLSLCLWLSGNTLCIKHMKTCKWKEPGVTRKISIPYNIR